MRKLPAALLPLPLGEVDLRSKDGEGAARLMGAAPHPALTRHLPPVGEGFSGSDTVSSTAKDVPLGELARSA